MNEATQKTKTLTKVGDTVKYDTPDSSWPVYAKVTKKNPKTVTLDNGTRLPYAKIVGWV